MNRFTLFGFAREVETDAVQVLSSRRTSVLHAPRPALANQAIERDNAIMYGLPKDTDLTPFHDKELTQVCMGAYQFQLHFSDGKTKDASVSVESGWKLHADNGQVLDFSDDTPDRSEEAAWLTRLIGNSIAKAEAVAPGTLRLRFSNGWVIEILDDSPSYESYQINIGGGLIIV